MVSLVAQTNRILILRNVFTDYQLYQRKKKKKKKKKKKGGASEWKKLIENHFQKNYLSTQTTLNLNVFKGMSW